MFAKKVKLALVIFITCGASSACSKKYIEVPRLRPAPLFVADYITLGVATLDGEWGNEIADVLHNTLSEQHRYPLIERSRIAAVQLPMAVLALNDVQAAELARRVGADAILFGRTQEVRHERMMVETLPVHDASDRKVFSQSSWLRRAHLSISVELRAVNASGQLLGAAEVASRSPTQEDRSPSATFSAVNWEMHRHQARKLLPRQFRLQLVPSKQLERTVLYSCGRLPQSQQALEAAQRGDWGLAISLYQDGLRRVSALNNVKYRSRAHYNLGMVLVLSGDCKEGMRHLQAAFDLQPSAQLSQIIATACRFAREAEQARYQLDVLAGDMPLIEVAPVDDSATNSLEPWLDNELADDL